MISPSNAFSLSRSEVRAYSARFPFNASKKEISYFDKVNIDRPFIAYYLHSLYVYVTLYRSVIRVRTSMYFAMYKLELSYNKYIRNFWRVGISCLFSGALTLVSRYGRIRKTGNPSLRCWNGLYPHWGEIYIIKIYHSVGKQTFSIRAELRMAFLN